jgi:hypothetical protein
MDNAQPVPMLEIANLVLASMHSIDDYQLPAATASASQIVSLLSSQEDPILLRAAGYFAKASDFTSKQKLSEAMHQLSRGSQTVADYAFENVLLPYSDLFDQISEACVAHGTAIYSPRFNGRSREARSACYRALERFEQQ